jgi:hypothetical protein
VTFTASKYGAPVEDSLRRMDWPHKSDAPFPRTPGSKRGSQGNTFLTLGGSSLGAIWGHVYRAAWTIHPAWQRSETKRQERLMTSRHDQRGEECVRG